LPSRGEDSPARLGREIAGGRLRLLRKLVSGLALWGALCCAPLASAQTVVPWPAAGAPLCTAPGDQFSLSPWARTLNSSLVSWFGHAGPVDSLHFGGAGDEPPTGGCRSESAAVTAGVVPGSVGTSVFQTGICLGCPGCGCLVDLAHAWVSRDAGGDQVVLRVRSSGWVDWSQADIVVRTAGSGLLSSPSLAACGPSFQDSSAIVVWVEGTGPGSQVRAQRVRPQGTLAWNGPDGIVLSPAGAAPSVVSIEPDRSVLVVWEDHRGASSDILALRLQPDGTPAPGWPAGGLALEGRSEESANPRLRALSNSFFVVWEESGARFGGGKSIVARKLLASGLPDPAWPDSGIVVTSSPTVDHLEDVSTFGSSIVWSDVRNAGPGNANDLFAQSLNDDGTRAAGWPADGVALSTATGSQDHARTANGLFAWEDTRSGETKVYATMLDLSGHRPCCWLADGDPVAVAAGVQQRPIVAGQFVYWEDGRDLATNGLDIYVQAFLGDGTRATFVGVEDGLPSRVAWREPFPNPARATTHLHLDLPRSAHVRVSVHDLLGRSVRTLSDGMLEAGPHVWDWRGADDAGSRVPPGLYHVRALVDGVASTRSVVWIR
jgi:hypothetical protein